MLLNEYLLKQEAFRDRTDFLIVQAYVSDLPNDTGLLVEIDNDPLVAHDREGRREFEKSGDPFWRWPAGGCAYFAEFVDKTVLFAIHRDSGAPTNPNTDTIGSGLGANKTEIVYPLRTAVREGVEELIIFSDEHMFYPLIKSDSFGFSLELRALIQTSADFFPDLRHRDIIGVPATFLELGSSIIHIIWQNDMFTTLNVLINQKPGIRGIDVLTSLILKPDCPFDEINCLDGEIVNGRPLDRIIRAYEVLEHQVTGRVIAQWESGKRVAPPEGSWPSKLNPNLVTIIDAFNSTQ